MLSKHGTQLLKVSKHGGSAEEQDAPGAGCSCIGGWSYSPLSSPFAPSLPRDTAMASQRTSVPLLL